MRYKFKLQFKSTIDAEFASHDIHINCRVKLWHRQATKTETVI
uniref:Uncharacterized protein n=1 Tax=Arundo donax TaxID=35708 RepID=A0A0A8YC17_ARUDO